MLNLSLDAVQSWIWIEINYSIWTNFLPKPGESLSFPERALYVQALHNLGYEAVLDDILASLTDNIPKENEKNQDLKVYIIKGLAAYSKQTAVRYNISDYITICK